MKLLIATLVAFTGFGLCAAPLALAQTADKAAIETKVKGLEDEWAKGDTAADHGASVQQGLLADDFAGVGSKGDMRTKAEYLAKTKSDTDTYTESKNDSMKVSVYGPSLATVCGTSTQKGKDKDGKEFTRSYGWVDTWMERNGKWQCIAGSGTEIKK